MTDKSAELTQTLVVTSELEPSEAVRQLMKGRAHFLAVSAQAMRRILVDHARTRGRVKRGGDWRRVVLDDQLAPPKIREVDSVALNDALETLATLDEQQARPEQSNDTRTACASQEGLPRSLLGTAR